MRKSRFRGHPGRLVVSFDFEGSYGMPYDVPYDVEASTQLILEELARYQARAVFFVVGRMVEEHPQVVRVMAEAGHEIGLHGYNHDNLARYDHEAVTRLADNLAKIGSLVQEITGVRPQGFRAPYLLHPLFYRPDVYALLKAEGYRWVSNRHVRYPVELFRPDRLLGRRVWRRESGEPPKIASSRAMLAPLNARLVMRETFGGSPVGRLRWLLGQRAPFVRDGLVEVPIYSPLTATCWACRLLSPIPRTTCSGIHKPLFGQLSKRLVPLPCSHFTTGSLAAVTG